jgi:mRNA interferase RelE/StbE
VTYRILIDARAAKQLEKLPKSIAERIDAAIAALSERPRPSGVKMLRGELKPGWRVRVGDYRVLYRIDDAAGEVKIFEIGHRREIYR